MTTIPKALAIAVEHHQAGRLQAAEEIYRQVLAVDAREANAWHLLGVLNAQRGRHGEGVECIQRALALRPDWAGALSNLGRALAGQRRFAEAEACCRRAIELSPTFEEAHDNLGLALQGQRKLDEAAACHRRALELKPDFVAARHNLGLALQGQGKWEEAAACYRQALQRNPSLAEAHNNLGSVLRNQGKLTDAVACYRRALDLIPGSARLHFNLGVALCDLGDLDQAAASYRRALELKPDYAEADSSLLAILHYRSSITLQELAAAHAAFERKHAAPLRAAWSPHENDRDLERPLRVGFLSRVFCRHPVGHFLIRLLENLGQDPGIAAICYHDGTANDDLTIRFRAAAAEWAEVRGQTDEQLAKRIRADRIDVLFDLAGHTGGNRLLVFARKPAPIQVTWADYVGTTGLSAMDCILADGYEIPAEFDGYYCERVLRMPDGYICYDPPANAPPVSSLPALEQGYVTFAAFHNPPKITPQAVEVWARILRRLSESRLVLKYRGMDDASVAGRLASLFATQGIDATRLEFLGFSPQTETLAQYQRVDLALDTFPYNGGLTTCEALWMGVPVVTCPGETFASRHSLSHMSNVGLTETIAENLDRYVEIAVSLAGDLPRLAALRSGLRERMAASPLCDGKRFAENFAKLLRGAWRDWCEKGPGFRVQGSPPDVQPEP